MDISGYIIFPYPIAYIPRYIISLINYPHANPTSPPSQPYFHHPHHQVVFRLNFFPFMNIVAGLLVIAIGADGVFILHDLKEEAKLKHPGHDPVSCHVVVTLCHVSCGVLEIDLNPK